MLTQPQEFIMLKESLTHVVLSEHRDVGDHRNLWGCASRGQVEHPLQSAEFPVDRSVLCPLQLPLLNVLLDPCRRGL